MLTTNSKKATKSTETTEPTKKIPVAILGVTGQVGHTALTLLNQHPLFQLAEISASSKKQGLSLNEIINSSNTSISSALTSSSPSSLANLSKETLNLKIKDPLHVESPFILSALPSDIAKKIEPELTSKGLHVFSNASNSRMKDNIPLLIPEINASHLSLINKQNTPGKLIKNPNCIVSLIAPALAPLLSISPIKHVSAVTLQAISGAGYNGISALEITGNTIPYIENEEEKIIEETFKILSLPFSSASISNKTTQTPPFSMTVNVHRVPIIYGHTVTLHIQFEKNITVNQVVTTFTEKIKTFPNLYQLHQNPFSPQPIKHLTPDDYFVHIGRIKQGSTPNMISLVAMGHNLVRGAAGASLLNMEAFYKINKNSHNVI